MKNHKFSNVNSIFSIMTSLVAFMGERAFRPLRSIEQNIPQIEDLMAKEISFTKVPKIESETCSWLKSHSSNLGQS